MCEIKHWASNQNRVFLSNRLSSSKPLNAYKSTQLKNHLGVISVRRTTTVKCTIAWEQFSNPLWISRKIYVCKILKTNSYEKAETLYKQRLENTYLDLSLITELYKRSKHLKQYLEMNFPVWYILYLLYLHYTIIFYLNIVFSQYILFIGFHFSS